MSGEPFCPDLCRLTDADSFLQYYNTPYCSARSLFTDAKTLKDEPRLDVSHGWADWLREHSRSRDTRLYVGLPASPAAANPAHYLELGELRQLLAVFQCDSRYQGVFGGVMLWEATFSDNNVIDGAPYAVHVKRILDAVDCAVE